MADREEGRRAKSRFPWITDDEIILWTRALDRLRKRRRGDELLWFWEQSLSDELLHLRE